MPSTTALAARVNDDNVVQEVIVIPYCNDNDDDITAFCNSIGLEGRWLDTSFTGSRRGKYAGQGDTYDPVTNQFVSPVS
jgi:hypothetical protein